MKRSSDQEASFSLKRLNIDLLQQIAMGLKIGGGDMLKSVYDKNNNGVVDDAEKLGGKTEGQLNVDMVDGHHALDFVLNYGDFRSIQVRNVNLNGLPDNPQKGDAVIGSDSSILYWYDGTSWKQIMIGTGGSGGGSGDMLKSVYDVNNNGVVDNAETLNGKAENQLNVDKVDGYDASAFAQSSHTHTKSQITDFAHQHTKSDISDFAHTHTKSEITDFAHRISHASGGSDALSPSDIGAAPSSHTHTKSQITDFSHTHIKSDITDFAHSHTKSDISDFAHKSSHATGGADQLTPSDIGAAAVSHSHTKSQITDFAHTHTEGDLSLSDVTTGDVSTSQHGFCPKAPNDTTKFLRGDGAWAVPSGGGGIMSVHQFGIKLASSNFYYAPFIFYNYATSTLQANYIYVTPFILGRNLTITTIAIQVTTAGAAGTVARVGIYSNGSDNSPGSLLYSTGDLATDATGVIAYSNQSWQLQAGTLYWMAVQGSGAPALRAIYTVTGLSNLSGTSAYSTSGYNVFRSSYGLPSSLAGMTWSNQTYVPIAFFQY